jgi:predicted Zn-dependent protease
VQRMDTAEEAIRYFERESYENQSASERYGRAVAYARAGRHLEANRIFEELVDNDQEVIAYHIGLAQSELALERTRDAVASFERARMYLSSFTTQRRCCNWTMQNPLTKSCWTC